MTQPLHPLEIIARREALNLSQADLADYFGSKQLTVSRWENGQRYPADDSFLRDGFERLERFANRIADDFWQLLEAQGTSGEPFALSTYRTDSEWHAVLSAQDPRLPVKVHQAIAGQIRNQAADEFDAEVTVTGP